jgi:hypothetical protein
MSFSAKGGSVQRSFCLSAQGALLTFPPLPLALFECDKGAVALQSPINTSQLYTIMLRIRIVVS